MAFKKLSELESNPLVFDFWVVTVEFKEWASKSDNVLCSGFSKWYIFQFVKICREAMRDICFKDDPQNVLRINGK